MKKNQMEILGLKSILFEIKNQWLGDGKKKMVNKVGDRVIQIIPSEKKVKLKKIFTTLSTMLTESTFIKHCMQ